MCRPSFNIVCVSIKLSYFATYLSINIIFHMNVNLEKSWLRNWPQTHTVPATYVYFQSKFAMARHLSSSVLAKI